MGVPRFRTRYADCPDCDQGQVYDVEYGFTARTCNTCDGTFEVEARCAHCERENPLNDDGFCTDCVPWTEQLTETLSDPFKRKAA